MKYFLILAMCVATNFVFPMNRLFTREELKIANYAIRKMCCLQGRCVCPRHYYGCRYFEERLTLEDARKAQVTIDIKSDSSSNKVKDD